jgi:hypothetical protein
MVGPTSIAGAVGGSIPAPAMQNMCPKHLAIENRQNVLHCFFEELKNIENRVAWFLPELCKAENGVPKDEQNQRRTELLRGCLAPRFHNLQGPVQTVTGPSEVLKQFLKRSAGQL